MDMGRWGEALFCRLKSLGAIFAELCQDSGHPGHQVTMKITWICGEGAGSSTRCTP